MNIEAVLRDLAGSRPIFHSEADFQHALAWSIHQADPGAKIRLELPRELDGHRVHLDLWVETAGERWAIELKYFTVATQAVCGAEEFRLKLQGAQDLGRYDFLKDVSRVERLVQNGVANRGAAIALCNDPVYWLDTSRIPTPTYAEFRLTEGRTLAGSLAWGAAAGIGTIRGRETPIELSGHYECKWREYSTVSATIGSSRFRTLVLEVRVE